MQPAYFQDLNAERLEPGEKPVQRRLIPQRTVQQGFDRLYRGGEPLEIQQGFGREHPGDPDLVVGGGWHRNPKQSERTMAIPLQCRPPARCAPCTEDEFVTLVRFGAG